MNTENSIKRIPLWCAFLPLSPLVIMLMIMHRWRKQGIIGFDSRWSLTSFLVVLGGFCAMLPFFPVQMIMGDMYLKTGSVIWLCLQIFVMYLMFLASSLTIREIDYRRLVRVLGRAAEQKG